jgi:RNA polymerase sigma factor (sigma-70 family)
MTIQRNGGFVAGRERRPEREPQPKRPYAIFAEEARATLLKEVKHYARTKLRGGLPVGFEIADFVQHALTKLTDLYDSRASEAAAYTYARTTAINALRDACRASERRARPGWRAGVLAAHGRLPMSPEEAAVAAATRRSVEEAMDRLPDRQRQAVRLMYMEGFSRQETAKIMDTTVDTVKSLAQRGRESLRRHLGKMPALAAIPRARVHRPSWLTLTTPQRAIVMAWLAVAQYPSVVRLPYTTPYAAIISDPRDHRPVTTGPPTVAAHVAASGPRSRVSVLRTPGTGSPRRLVPHSLLPPRPKAGGCFGSTCVGDQYKGDLVCVEAGQDFPPVCAYQDVIGLCPTIDHLALPGTSCTRYSDPAIDP